MNLAKLVDSLLFFVSQWAGVTIPRIVAVLMGGTLCVFAITALWDRRMRAAVAFFWIVFGGLLVLVALDTRFLHMLAATTYLARIRLLMVLLSGLVLVVTFESIRRSHLQERYALLWVATGLIILLCALFPNLLDVFTRMLGVQYVTAVVAVVFTFLILVAFHFSIALSSHHEDRTCLAQRCALLEARIEELERLLVKEKKPDPIEYPAGPVPLPAAMPASVVPATRIIRGGHIVAPLLIAIAVLAVLVTGALSPQAMIGDEVTHYFMLVKQADTLPAPNFFAHIPMAFGGEEVRGYPHPNLWHYFGAMVYRYAGHSFMAVQGYQAVFWAQWLVVAFLLARWRNPSNSRAALLFLLVLGSLPMGLIFSVSFYQDVPVAAQALTAFYLLEKRRPIWATIFMAITTAMKVTGVIFLPPFLLLLVWRVWCGPSSGVGVSSAQDKTTSAIAKVGVLLICVGLLTGVILLTRWEMFKYGAALYYPVEEVVKWFSSCAAHLPDHAVETTGLSVAMVGSDRVTPYETQIIANHPGDLRLPVNFLVYGGILMWLVVLFGVVGWFWPRGKRSAGASQPSTVWLWCVGLFFLIVASYQLRTAPDARFFLPAIPFLLLPFVESAVRLPYPRLMVAVATAIAVLQGGQVLAKVRQLRAVSPPMLEAVHYLKAHPPAPNRLFMYPEGNYRLFPSTHDWYLNYQLRAFWRADNNRRIEMLQQYGIGAVVIKKHLIAEVDEAITNLGVYPVGFVRDMAKDSRFKKLFENDAVIIYQVPASSADRP